MARKTSYLVVTSKPVRVVGKERAALVNAHGREKVNQSIAVWIALVKGIERSKTSFQIWSLQQGHPQWNRKSF